MGSGLGLGLSIAQQLVNLHGSQLHVESEVGRGSAFTFSLPSAAPAAWDQSSAA
jgi:signal transduction histidine kinase